MLEVVCETSFTQLSLPLSPSTSVLFLPPPVVISYLLCLLLSPLISPSFPLPAPKTIFFSHWPFFPPSSCLHLLSQGPCGTLRGWWGWGWWWCRWWWNSDSVSSLSVLETRSLSLPCLRIFYSFPAHPSRLLKAERMRMREKTRTKASCLCHSFIHASLCSTPHHHATHATCVCVCLCVCLPPVCFPCCHCCLVWCLLEVALKVETHKEAENTSHNLPLWMSLKKRLLEMWSSLTFGKATNRSIK